MSSPMTAQEATAESEAGLSGAIPQCLNCAWLDPTLNTCRAFPGGIPLVIRLNEIDHRLPYPDDNGLRYIPVNDAIKHPLDERAIPNDVQSEG